MVRWLVDMGTGKQMAKKPIDGSIELEVDGTSVRDLLKINKNGLDLEMEKQADLFYRICENHMMAMSTRDAAWEDIKRTEAALDSEVRADLASTEDKVTEAMVKAAVADHPKRQKVYDYYLNLKLRADLWGAARDSFDQRSKMLREIASLWVAGYWVASSTTGGKGAAYQEKSYEAGRRRIAEARKERKANE
jgi:hypothetical protein